MNKQLLLRGRRPLSLTGMLVLVALIPSGAAYTLEFSGRAKRGCLLSSFVSGKYRGGGERSREFVVGRRRRKSFHAPASLQCHHRTFADDGETPLIIPEADCDNYLMLKRRSMISLLLLSSASTTSFASASAAEAEEPTECQNGRIVSESAVPGAYQQACMNLDERSFRLDSTGDVITVYQGTNAGGGMAGRTGVAVWNSGILLTRLLDKLNQSVPNIFKHKSIIELGCGTALASISAARLGASSVLSTDSNPEVLSLAQRNIERNELSDVAKTATIQWGLLDATEYESYADVVIGSDLTYNSGSWLALAETMATVLKPGGIVIYLTLGHSGFNVGGELGGFLSVAENTGLQLLSQDRQEWKDTFGSSLPSLDDLLSSVVSREEKSVVDANGGARCVILGKKKYSRKG